MIVNKDILENFTFTQNRLRDGWADNDHEQKWHISVLLTLDHNMQRRGTDNY